MAKKENVVSLFAEPPYLPELKVDDALLASHAPAEVRAAAALDLTGKPKVLLANGNGGSGKTTLLRWICERALIRDDGTELLLASVDPVNRELTHYFRETLTPKAGDAGQWLEKLLQHLLDTKKSAAIDFGGGDTTLRTLAAEMDLVGGMTEGGLEPVALYLFTPRETDINPLAAMEAVGFKPAATALILNRGRADPSRDPAEEFAQIRRHSVYRAALDRGAVELWMPRLHAAKQVEDRRITFSMARDGKMPGGIEGGLGLFDRSRVRQWLRDMDAAFAPVMSWLP